ncbi:MAG: 50S ribosomal protein L3 [Candidatus Improbicoccus devescovinae]|nr:MAG: 50S ribosomal protein L3 [Candidatus Improbicoccus devescovinae]
MKKSIIGKKLGMTQIFTEKGLQIPITVVEAGPCVVCAKKNIERDGYNSVQLGFGKPNSKRIKKPLKVFFEKNNLEPKKILHEFRLDDCEKYNVGDIISLDIFSAGEYVDVTSKSKGKGWAGVIKRWNFRRLKESHGTGPVVRHGGSIGMCSNPSRVFKGKKMSGRLGGDRVTVQNLKIVKVDQGNNLIAIRGAIPGAKGCVVFIKNSVKARKQEVLSNAKT